MHETPRLLPGGVFYISVFPENHATRQNIKRNRLVLVGFESSLSILEGSG